MQDMLTHVGGPIGQWALIASFGVCMVYQFTDVVDGACFRFLAETTVLVIC